MRFFFLMPCASLLTSVALADPVVESASFSFDETSDNPAAAVAKGARLGQGEFSANLTGDVAIWGGYVGDDALLDNGDRMQEPGFRLRRARLGAVGQLMSGFNYQIELDLFDQEHDGGPLYKAWLEWHSLPLLSVRVGLQTVPYSQGLQFDTKRMAFLARPMAIDAMAPANAVGLSVQGNIFNYAELTVGAFNGFQRQSSFQQGYKAVGGSSGNRFERMAYVSRLDVHPLARSANAGGEADLQKHMSLRLSLGGSLFFNDGESIESRGYSGYLHAKIAGFSLFGEALFEHAEPQAKPTTTATIATKSDRKAFVGSLGYMILKNRLGFAVRAELLDANDAYDDEQDELVLGASLTWYQLGEFLKFRLEYLHREERYGVTLENDAYLAGAEFAF